MDWRPVPVQLMAMILSIDTLLADTSGALLGDAFRGGGHETNTTTSSSDTLTPSRRG